VALVTESFNGDGVSETFTVSNEVLSKSHVRVHYYYDLVDHEVPDDDWDLLGKGTVVFVDAPSNGYIVKVTTSTDGTGLGTLPSDLNTLTALTPDISIVADMASNVTVVANDLAGVNNIGTVVSSLSLLNAVNNNKVNVDTVAADLQLGIDSKVKIVKDNIVHVQQTGSNIGSIVALEANYDEIKTVSEQANFGLFNAINLSANVIGVNATIATGQNGVSFGDMTIEEGVTVTIEEGSSWAII